MKIDHLKYLRHTRSRIRATSSKENTQIRTVFQRDFDRILFSSDFRRLQNKTQVLPLPESDFVHNRLTHSLETSSVGRSLGIQIGNELIKKNPSLSEADFSEYDFGFMVSSAALAHDIGNPPFGHAGEDAISSYFQSGEADSYLRNLDAKQQQDLKDFEGNSAGFRLLVTSLKTKTDIPGGLNLTLGTLASFTKYPKESLPNRKKEGLISLKKYGFFQAEKEIFQHLASKLSLQEHNNKEGDFAWKRFPLAYLVEAADDICYHIIDFEDGYNIGYIPYEMIFSYFQKILSDNWENYDKNLQQIHNKKSKIAYMRSMVIHTLISKAAKAFLHNEEDIFNGNFRIGLLDSIDTDTQDVLSEILSQSISNIYQSPTVLKIEAAGYRVLPDLLDKFLKGIFEPKEYKRYYRLIPEEYRDKDVSDYEKALNVSMWISSMTDRYAVELFKNLNGIELPRY